MTEQSMENYLPIWCEGCNEQGFIFVEDVKQPVFVVCEKCGYETAEVWCEESRMGGEFVRDIEGRPERWECPDCEQVYELPGDFYENPVPLVLEGDLPGDVRGEMKEARREGGDKWVSLAILAMFVSVVYSLYCIDMEWVYLPGFGRGYIIEGTSLIFWVLAIGTSGFSVMVFAIYKHVLPNFKKKFGRYFAVVVGVAIVFFVLALRFAKYGMLIGQ